MLTFNSRQLQKIVEYRGKVAELLKAIEEFGELTREVVKALQNRADIDHLVEEIADVYIMLEHIKNIFNIPESKVQNIIRHKLDREENRIEKEKERENAKRIYV